MPITRNILARTLLIMSCLSLTQGINAHRLYDVDINVLLNDKGHARVVETRMYKIGEGGSEIYIKQYKLGVMDLGELAVQDETGLKYALDEPWNESASRAQKTGRCGIYNGESGPEICWGIGDSGYRTYIARYTLTRMVKAYNDYDGFNFNFYEAASPRPDHVRVTISKQNASFTKDDTRMWAFGFHGEVQLVDGKIVAETKAADVNTVTVLARFNKEVFHPVTTVNGTFRDILQKPAFKGSDYSLELADQEEEKLKASQNGNGYQPEEDGWKGAAKALWEVVEMIIAIAAWIFVPIKLFGGFFSLKNSIVRDRRLKSLFGVPKPESQEWSRDIPLNGDLNYANAVIDAVENKKNQHLMAAHILRMAYQGRIMVRQKPDANGNLVRVFAVNNPGPPPLNSGQHNENDIAYLLHRFMWNAAGSDRMLEPKELMNYVKMYPVEHREFVRLLSKHLNGNPSLSIAKVSKQAAREVFGLKKFLQEFTLTDERHLEEVALWREYMVYATLFGNADQVKKDLKNVWPMEQPMPLSEFLMEDTVTMSTVLYDQTRRAINYVSSYETPQERADRLAREAEESRSSGGGGSSSYGGGGGSSGGGGSGIR